MYLNIYVAMERSKQSLYVQLTTIHGLYKIKEKKRKKFIQKFKPTLNRTYTIHIQTKTNACVQAHRHTHTHQGKSKK